MADKHSHFPGTKVRLFMVVWRVVWFVFMPVVLIYLWRRARKEKMYFQYLPERFGFHTKRTVEHVWIHAVSLGELRSATHLIDRLLEQGEHVVVTHFTPAGRSETLRIYADEVAAGRVVPVWVPFDYDRAFARFFRAFSPKYGLVMEVEFWPAMIMSSRKRGVPLFLCNGQYPQKSFDRDQEKWLSRIDIIPGFAGAFVKSDRMAEPFRKAGLDHVVVTGELRFDQPIDMRQAKAGKDWKARVLAGRNVVVFASTVLGEDQMFIEAMKQIQTAGPSKPLFVYVPRKPERFDDVAQVLTQSGLVIQRRSQITDADFTPPQNVDFDVILGDSLGEMHFYLAMADRVVVGGGFVAQGSHNIIEPLLHQKPVIVGPEIWTIDFPAQEAIAAGVCRQISAQELPGALSDPTPWPAPDLFLKSMQGGAERSLLSVSEILQG